MKENYHKKMLEILEELKGASKVPTLLLHTCCAPCSTTVIKRLSEYFQITVFYYTVFFSYRNIMVSWWKTKT